MTLIPAEDHVYTFSPRHPACAVVPLASPITFETTSRPYQALTPEAIDSDKVNFRKVNLLTGPVFVEGVGTGDALGVTIDEITVEGEAYAPYIPRWRSGSFDMTSAIIPRYPIRANMVELSETVRIPISPMIGCLGVAPARGEVSSLGPATPTGGNLDLVEARPGTTIWLPVEVQGALFALGDLHARMGRGEPAGVGLECAGTATVRFSVRHGANITGPIIETDEKLAFVGTDRHDLRVAEQNAVRAAFRWLKSRVDLDDATAFGIAAALLDINFGGPAGAIVVGSLLKRDLSQAGLAIALGAFPSASEHS